MVEAIPCNDVHDDSHKPVAVTDGVTCGPLKPKPLSDLLLHRAASGVRASEVDLEGCVDGRGEAFLELEKVDDVES